MKTKLPISIKTVEEAIAFLTALHTNGEQYHPEDNAHDILWTTPVTICDENQLNALMEDIYNLPGNDGRHNDLAFDPCEYLLLLGKADVAITIDGEPTTIGAYMQANKWDAISDHVGSLAYLEDDDDLVVPIHVGFVTIKLLNK